MRIRGVLGRMTRVLKKTEGSRDKGNIKKRKKEKHTQEFA